MSWDITDRFPNWGESGESPQDGFFYEGGDQVNEKHLDYLWNSVKGLEDDVQASLNDIDSDGDGKVDAADTADDAVNVTSTYKGNDIDSDGDGRVDGADNGVPSGGIVMWSGSTTNVPSGWTLCDGTDGAPDLRNRFIVGAGDEYSVGDTGGEKEHTLTENEMPSHDHGYTESKDTNKQFEDAGFVGAPEGNQGTFDSTTGSAGGNQAHENRPRFYSLAYIYKL